MAWCQNIVKLVVSFLGVIFVSFTLFPLQSVAQAYKEPIAPIRLITLESAKEDIHACGECHGTSGAPRDSKLPIIWGQNAAYLEKQLRDYRSGQRENQIMTSMAEGIPKEKLSALAQILSFQPWPKSELIESANDPSNSVTQEDVQVCLSCHAQSRKGEPLYKGSPRLSGQNAEYLLDQMLSWVNQDRNNSELMSQLLKNKSKQQLQALSIYFSKH